MRNQLQYYRIFKKQIKFVIYINWIKCIKESKFFLKGQYVYHAKIHDCEINNFPRERLYS